jgi:hypothetical protein
MKIFFVISYVLIRAAVVDIFLAAHAGNSLAINTEGVFQLSLGWNSNLSVG